MSNALISVIIPVYNARPYLADAVRSVCRCDYRELEIILVDDGSTDGSGRICDTFAGFDSRVKVVHKERGGAASARNAGLKAASGEWISFCDADDKIEPKMYTYLVKKAEKYAADIVQCGIYFDSEGDTKITYTPPCDIILRTDSRVLERHFLELFAYSCYSKIWRRSLIAELKFDERWAVGEDLRFGLDALSGSHRIVFASKPMYRYVQRDGSIMHTADRETLTAFDGMIKSAEADFEKTKVLGKVSKRIRLLNCTDMCSRAVLSDIPGGDEVFDAVHREVRKNIPYVLFASRLPKKEKRKLAAIALAPKFYKKLLSEMKDGDGNATVAAEEPVKSPETASEVVAAPEVAVTSEVAEVPEVAAEPEVVAEPEVAAEPEAAEAPEIVTPEVTEADAPVTAEAPVAEEADAPTATDDVAAKEYDVEKVQRDALSALGEIKRICESHGIKYYLTAGTLLGAVRHGGFIPWDDDIDVLIPRADFGKFEKAVKAELADGFFYQSGATDKNYPFSFTKIRACGSELVESSVSGLGIRGGAYADIFPLDKCPVKDSRAERFFKLTRFVQTALIAKGDGDFAVGYEKKSAKVAFAIARRMPRALLRAFRTLVRVYYALTSRGERLATVEGSHGYPRETYSAHWFEKKAIAQFEGEKYRVPSGWQELLTNMYGDFMTLPEESERRGHFTK